MYEKAQFPSVGQRIRTAKLKNPLATCPWEQDCWLAGKGNYVNALRQAVNEQRGRANLSIRLSNTYIVNEF